MSDLIIPARIKKGDTIGLVAPGGPVDQENFAAGLRLIDEMGFKARFHDDIFKRTDYLAGDDATRARLFNLTWQDPDVKAVLAVRGGYGSLRMVSGIDMAVVRKNPKILIGFSDVTVLLMSIMKMAGLAVFHGPMLSTLATASRDATADFFRFITGGGDREIKKKGLEILVGGSGRGILFGGNLTNLAHLVGTPYEIRWDGCILFLEDINEEPYRIDRMLTHLDAAGRFDMLAGVVLGSFKNCGDTEQIWNRALSIFEKKSIPLWADFPVGHGDGNKILPLGREVEMDGNAGVLRLPPNCLT